MGRRAGMNAGKVFGHRGDFSSEKKGHRSVDSDATTKPSDLILGVDTSSSAHTVTLASSEKDEGRVIIVVDESDNASVNNITVNTEGSENIDGSSSQTISTDSGQLHIYSDGSDWHTI